MNNSWRVRKYLHTMERLGLVVREEREALALNMEQLARAANVSVEFIAKVESGHADSLSGTRRILDALGIKPLVLPGELMHFA